MTCFDQEMSIFISFCHQVLNFEDDMLVKDYCDVIKNELK